MSTVASSLAAVPLAIVPAAAAAPQAPTPKRWTREEYYRLDEQGWFQNQRVELIDGEIILLSPQSPQHLTAILRVMRLLDQSFGASYVVRPQGPVTHGDFSEPEPDLAVVRGRLEDFENEHPTVATLIVEISRTSLQFDQTIKQRLYARMGVPEYWILDIDHRQLIVHREPTTAAKDHVSEYRSIVVVAETGSVSPLEKPDATLAVADMLPSAA